MVTLSFFIPGAPASPNHRGRTVRERMSTTRGERDRAWLYADVALREAGMRPIIGPATIQFDVYRCRLLDPMANLPASLKAMQDGVWKAVLPLGDGSDTPYTWRPVRQVRVRHRQDEGVQVTVTVEEAVALLT